VPTHYLQELQNEVDATHKGLGKLYAFCVLAAKAEQALLIVSPPGCGKSTVLKALRRQLPETIWLETMTEAGMNPYADQLTDYRGSILFDDLAGMRTAYRREHTLSTFTALVTNHEIGSHTGHQHLEITGFHGSVMCGCQPVVLAPLLKSENWDGLLADKTIRYYHLKRPVEPVLAELDLEVRWGKDINNVSEPLMADPWYVPLLEIGKTQWTKGRNMEHTSALLKAAAALDERLEVTPEDAKILMEVMKPLAAEAQFVVKESLDGERRMRRDYMYLLIEFASYDGFTVDDLAEDYRTSKATAYAVLERNSPLWVIRKKSPTKYYASITTHETLSEIT